MTFSFKCTTCNQIHEGMPSFGADAPTSYYDVPEDQRARRCDLGSDDCVIDGQSFFVRGCLEIPVHGQSQPFVWGVWISLSQTSFMEWLKCFDQKKRSHIGPFFGWLNASLRPYPETFNLKTNVRLRDDGTRPFIEVQPTNHPLAVEQRDGISEARLAEIYSLVMHADA